MDLTSDFGEIIQAKCNSNGTQVAMTLAATNLIPDGKLYIWDIDSNDFHHYDFRKSHKEVEAFDEDTVDVPAEEVDGTDVQSSFREICQNRIPLSLFWDKDDPRLLICNAKRLKYGLRSVKKNPGDYFSLLIFTHDGLVVTLNYVMALGTIG